MTLELQFAQFTFKSPAAKTTGIAKQKKNVPRTIRMQCQKPTIRIHDLIFVS